jgi:hypothetical protein
MTIPTTAPEPAAVGTWMEETTTSTSTVTPPVATSTATREFVKQSVRENRKRPRSQPATVVFASLSHYDYIVMGLMSLAPLALIFSMIMINMDKSLPEEEVQRKVWILVWTLILVFVIYMAILPRQIDVRSNGSIGVKTALFTYIFTGVCRAYEAGIGREDFVRSRLKFGASLTANRVVVRRRHGKSDIVVTPSDPQGFVQAVEQVVGQLDALNEEECLEAGDKPDLAAVV